MRRVLAILGLSLVAVLALTTSVSAATVSSRYQLRGHLPELGERPTMRVFLSQAEYDSYRNSLGEANVFPPASGLFMSFDKDILALYTRGNDTGGRCIATQVASDFTGGTLSTTASWQAGTCGAPSSAHYPFILLAISRTAVDGSTWLQSARSVCLMVETQDTSACATLSGASPAPTATSPPAPTASPSSSPSASTSTSPSPTATRSLTPSQTATATPTPTATAAATASPSRSPVAAASPTAAPAADSGATNVLLYAMLIAIGFLVLLSLFLSRSGSSRRRR